MFRSLARLALVFATLVLILATFVMLVPDTTFAHDSWISRGGHRNAYERKRRKLGEVP